MNISFNVPSKEHILNKDNTADLFSTASLKTKGLRLTLLGIDFYFNFNEDDRQTFASAWEKWTERIVFDEANEKKNFK